MSILSKSETADLIGKMKLTWPQGSVPKVKNFKSYEIDVDRLLLVSDEVIAVRVCEKIIPFLDQRGILEKFPSIAVDMGAIRFVCNGARVMRPGIVQMDSFKNGDIVVIRDQQHGKALAVGIAIEESVAAQSMAKGYVSDNLHHVSDKVWEAYKEIQPKRS